MTPEQEKEFEETEIPALVMNYEDLVESAKELAEDYLEHVYFEKSHPMSGLASELRSWDKIENGEVKIKDFISFLLSAQKKQITEKLEAMKTPYTAKMMTYHIKDKSEGHIYVKYGRNKAIQDAINLINNDGTQ